MNDDTQTLITYFVIAVLGTSVLVAGANFKKENPYSAMGDAQFGLSVSRDDYSTELADEFCRRRGSDFYKIGDSDAENLARCFQAFRLYKRVL
jgi:hypothetical protein